LSNSSSVEALNKSNTSPLDTPASIFVARQPIFQKDLSLYGYELLFRSGPSGVFDCADATQATLRLISNTFLSIGAEQLLGKRLGFINFDRTMLVADYAAMLPKESVVIEILETVEQDAEVVAACRKLKGRGYLLALDDFSGDESSQPLTALADIIKVDFRATGRRERHALFNRYEGRGITMVAEKIESASEFREARETGFALFQGYVFGRPATFGVPEVPGLKVIHLELLGELANPRLDYPRLVRILKQDASISYKLLRFLNSPLFGWSGAIASIEHGLALIGEQEVRRWIAVVALSGLLQDQPTELMIRSLVRAEFCAALSLSCELRQRSPEMFLMALLSLVGTMLGCTLEAVLKRISLKNDVRDALLGRPPRTEQDGSVSRLYSLMLAYEKADWERVLAISAKMYLQEWVVAEAYLKSINWADEVVSHSFRS
jgi:c-di-GMP-related signal transduction protein